MTVVVVGVAGAWYLCGCLSTKGALKPINDATGSSGVASADPADPAGMTTAEFLGLPKSEQLDFAAPKLNSATDQTAENMSAALNGAGWDSRNLLDGVEFVTPSLSNTPQQIWNQVALGTFQAWNTARNGSVAEATKLAAGVAEGRPFDQLVNAFSDSRPDISLGAAYDAEPVISSGSYRDVGVRGGQGLIEFNVRFATDTHVVANVIARFEHGTNSGSARWILVESNEP